MDKHKAKRIIHWLRASVSSSSSIHWSRASVSDSNRSEASATPGCLQASPRTKSNFLTTKFFQTKNSTLNSTTNRKKIDIESKKSKRKHKKPTKNRPKPTPKTAFLKNGSLKTLTKMKIDSKTHGKTPGQDAICLKKLGE